MANYLGYSRGETCNREGCEGIIEEMETDGCCSCHINAPCSNCESGKGYCESCGWDGKEEQESFREAHKVPNSLIEAYEKRAAFQQMYDNGKGCEKLEYTREGHSNSSMKYKGIYPNGSISDSELISKIRGTFGGRFEYWHIGESFTRFIYIAYTD